MIQDHMHSYYQVLYPVFDKLRHNNLFELRGKLNLHWKDIRIILNIWTERYRPVV